MRFPLTTVKAIADKVSNGRSCGSCTACCVLPRIGVESAFPDGKPGYTPCDKLCTSGCSVYKNRPELCKDYICLWRAGIIDGDERRRPDQLGLMFTLDTNAKETEIIVEAWELWDKAASENPGRYFIDTIAQKFKVSIRFYGVPASIRYVGVWVFELGAALSRASMDDPRALAAWCEENVFTGNLRVVDDPSNHEQDLVSLKRGEPVVRYYEAYH